MGITTVTVRVKKAFDEDGRRDVDCLIDSGAMLHAAKSRGACKLCGAYSQTAGFGPMVHCWYHAG